jgi:SHS2 domain-containing protein
VEHTADWELEVWAPDIAALLEESARGMYELMNIELATGPRQRRRITLEAADLEQLLVEFLDELLYLGESEELGCDRYRLTVEGTRLESMVEGVPIVSQGKEIKAVTYHRLEIEETEDGLQTRIVFDV